MGADGTSLGGSFGAAEEPSRDTDASGIPVTFRRG